MYGEDTAGRGASSSGLFVVSCSESPSRISEEVNKSALGSVSSDFIQVLGGCTVLVLSGKKAHRFYHFFSSPYLTFKLEVIFLMLGKQDRSRTMLQSLLISDSGIFQKLLNFTCFSFHIFMMGLLVFHPGNWSGNMKKKSVKI